MGIKFYPFKEFEKPLNAEAFSQRFKATWLALYGEHRNDDKSESEYGCGVLDYTPLTMFYPLITRLSYIDNVAIIWPIILLAIPAGFAAGIKAVVATIIALAYTLAVTTARLFLTIIPGTEENQRKSECLEVMRKS